MEMETERTTQVLQKANHVQRSSQKQVPLQTPVKGTWTKPANWTRTLWRNGVLLWNTLWVQFLFPWRTHPKKRPPPPACQGCRSNLAHHQFRLCLIRCLGGMCEDIAGSSMRILAKHVIWAHAWDDSDTSNRHIHKWTQNHDCDILWLWL